MDSTINEITHDFSPFFRVHKDGRIERFKSPQYTPPSDNPNTPVRSKDVVIATETGVSVRLFLPQTTTTTPPRKLPLLVYIHGGAFCLASASTPTFHNYVTSLVAKSNVVAVSVDYRLAPEHPLPAAYDDSWAAIQWVASHGNGSGPDPWLNGTADLQRLFLGGESAGANLANHVAIQAGVTQLPHGVKIKGLFLVQPFLGGKEVDEMYRFMCPSSSGCDDDPRLNPAADPRLASMGCDRVLIVVAERDRLRERGRGYYEALGKSGWGGEVEMREVEGEGHGFHLLDHTSVKAANQMTWLADFLNKE